jgi:hypothetical protein
MVKRSATLATFGKCHGLGVSSARSIWVAVLSLLLALSAPRGQAQVKPAPGLAPGTAFAFSDFDGDLRPDVAVIQAGRSDRSFTDYWVQLKLTTAGMQSIRIVGPTGGLQVLARDVNGDDVPDLVLTTLWRNQPVAILLNDGTGGFSRVDPSVFPGAFSPFETGCTGPLRQEDTLLVALTQFRAGFSPLVARLPYLGSSGQFLPRGELAVLRNNDRPTRAGRAPPTGPTLL